MLVYIYIYIFFLYKRKIDLSIYTIVDKKIFFILDDKERSLTQRFFFYSEIELSFPLSFSYPRTKKENK